jgi:hypothetical protein
MTKSVAEYLLPPPVESEYTVIRPESALALVTNFQRRTAGDAGRFHLSGSSGER